MRWRLQVQVLRSCLSQRVLALDTITASGCLVRYNRNIHNICSLAHLRQREATVGSCMIAYWTPGTILGPLSPSFCSLWRQTHVLYGGLVRRFDINLHSRTYHSTCPCEDPCSSQAPLLSLNYQIQLLWPGSAELCKSLTLFMCGTMTMMSDMHSRFASCYFHLMRAGRVQRGAGAPSPARRCQ